MRRYLIVFAAVQCFNLLASHAFAAERPNFVMILADDLGYGDLGCYGQTLIQTPSIDQMAAEGMKWTQFYSGSTVCAPSRSTLMTGLHTGHTDMRGNGDVEMFPETAPFTLPSLLQTAGYDTAMIGKSCTSCSVSKNLSQPNTMGFDHFYGVLSHTQAHHYFPPNIYEDGKAIEISGNHEHEGTDFCHDLYLADAQKWLSSRTDRPFFLLYSAHLPHASLNAPEDWVDLYRGMVPEEYEVKEGHYRGTQEPNATFAGMISRLDWEVGELLATLAQKNVADNTLVIFISDNGAHSAGGHKSETFHSSGNLRGEKRDLYEGGIRTPMITRWPGVIEAGSATDQIGAFWDLLPTLCSLASVPLPTTRHYDGIDLAPTLTGHPEKQSDHPILYWEFFEQGGKRAVRFENFKAVQIDVVKEPDGPVEIYDLSSDLKEEKNLSAARQDLVDRARQLFKSERTVSPVKKFNFPAH